MGSFFCLKSLLGTSVNQLEANKNNLHYFWSRLIDFQDVFINAFYFDNVKFLNIFRNKMYFCMSVMIHGPFLFSPLMLQNQIVRHLSSVMAWWVDTSSRKSVKSWQLTEKSCRVWCAHFSKTFSFVMLLLTRCTFLHEFAMFITSKSGSELCSFSL